MTESYRIRAEEPASDAVVQAVASATNRESLELPPIYDAIDPDGLDALFAATDEATREGITISFAYAGCDVAVDASEVRVRRSDG